MIFALINDETNIVENVVVLNAGVQWIPPDNDYVVDITDLEVGINWTYNPDTNEWTPPPPPPEPPKPPVGGTPEEEPDVIE